MRSIKDFAKLGKKLKLSLILIKLIALSICVIFASGSLLSTAFVFTHAHHEHDHHGHGGGCAVCAQMIAAVESQLKPISAAIANATHIFEGFAAALPIQKLTGFRMSRVTPVCLKVRLNH
jgi:hypothetical protein